MNEKLLCEFCLSKNFKNKFTLERHKGKSCAVLKMISAIQKRKEPENDSVELFVNDLVSDLNRYVNEGTANYEPLIVNKIKDSEFTVREVRGIVERNLDTASEDVVKMSEEVDARIAKLNPDIAYEVNQDIAELQDKDNAHLDQEIEIGEILLTEMKRLRLLQSPDFVVVKKLFDIIQDEVNKQRTLPVSKRSTK
jgi:hypothetical protein